MGGQLDDKTSYWLELAEYDLDTAEAMLETGRYLYVGFMCHQVIEKALKASITAVGAEPPYIHNLAKLADRAGLYGKLSNDQKQILASLDPLNIQARYPEDKERLSAALTREKCVMILAQTKETYGWIRATL